MFHEDLDLTGGVLSRPGLDRMMDRVRAGETGGVVVAYVDRLSRAGVGEALKLVEEIHEAGGKFAALDLGIDPTTPFGEFGLTVLLALARMQRRRIAEGWQSARERAVRRGVTISSTVPTGYRRRDDGRLEPDPKWAPVVRDVFERRAAGASWAELARYINDQGVPVRYASGDERGNGARWTGSTVSRLVGGRVYLGESSHGGITNAEAHEPLVTASLWHAAQAARGVASTRSMESPALLAGLVRCAGCGYGMYRGTGKGANGSTAVHYRCRGGGSGGRCEHRGFANAWDLDALVIREYLHHAEAMAAISAEDASELDPALTELDEAEHALRVFRDDPRIIGALGADAFAEGLEERARRVHDAREMVESARQSLNGTPDVVTLREVWPELDVIERRRLLTAALDCVVVDGSGPLVPDRVRMCWAGVGPSGLPSRGRRGSGLRPIRLDDLPEATRVTLPKDRE